ncbi:MAG: hypothetical protein IJ905_18585 [Fibrobacter sp.]|nr:hypothetical protein [Fibrobacter sp.]
MKIKYLVFVTAFFALLSGGCSDKNDVLQDFVKEQNKMTVDKKSKDSLKRVELQQHKEIQAKFNTHAECVKSQNVDILKDSVRFKAIFDSCWHERMKGL